jgi:DNA-binding CsgD family transcriptional regulator
VSSACSTNNTARKDQCIYSIKEGIAMIQVLPDKTEPPHTVLTDNIYEKRNNTTTYKKTVLRKSDFTNFMDTCYELQSTVDSIQGLIRLYPDCRTSDSYSQEKVMHLMNEILDQKKKNLSSQIASILETHNRKSRQAISRTGYSTVAEQKEELKEEQENTLTEPTQSANDHALMVCMDSEDWKRFASLSYHMGIAPSIMALIILKQATLQAKDGNGLEDFLLFSTSPSPQAPHLFPRETEILNLVAKGHSNREIAGSLHISDRTVKNHVTSIMRKLKAQNRTHAVIRAQQYRLV